MASSGWGVNCLFVGAGDIATSYAAGLSDRPLSLVGVCDIDGERAAAFAEAFDCRAFSDMETALRATDAPLVVNLTSQDRKSVV